MRTLAPRCCRGRPLTNLRSQHSTCAGRTRRIGTSCPRRPFWAAVVVGFARSRSRCYRTDVSPAAAFQAQSRSLRLDTCIHPATHNEHAACRLRSRHRSAGRGRSELDASEPIWTLVNRPNAQDLVDILAHAAGSYQYATAASLRLDGRVSFASISRFHAIAGVARWNTKNRSDLHNRTEANAL
jgi:hypothetical protein